MGGPEESEAAMPESSPAGTFDVDVAETHISVLFFLGDRVYKLKKPVVFPFVDLTTREARERLCHREVELNRRLAPDVYLGVADVSDPSGGPDVGPLDHLVVMRRMPAGRRLSALVVAGDASVPPAVEQLGRLLAEFHRGADRSAAIDAAATPDAVAARWRENFDELRPFAGSVLDATVLARAEHLCERFLAGRAVLFDERIAQGHVCDGHGDLQADDVFCLDDGPRVLDCLEFADELRFGDVANDVAFLVMDLERLGATAEADHLVQAYETAAGAALPPALLRFYVAYRAQVRAKVACLRTRQQPAGRADEAASEVRARALLTQCVENLEAATVRLVVVGGLPGTGKSTLAAEIGERTGAVVIRSDVVRKQRVGLSPTESAAAGFGEGLYESELTDEVYAEMVAQARREVERGRSVVLDASFVAERHRRLVRALAGSTATDLVELRCVLDPAEAARRIERRQAFGADASDADAGIAAAMAVVADPWPEAHDLSSAVPARCLRPGGARPGAGRRPAPGSRSA